MTYPALNAVQSNTLKHGLKFIRGDVTLEAEAAYWHERLYIRGSERRCGDVLM